MPDIPAPLTRPALTLLALGFRPFFLAAGVWAVLSLLLWLAMLRGLLPMDLYYGATTWHAHEMLFGYGTAVIAGFLLTATRNWTGLATASGAELAGLVLLWAAGRMAPLLASLGGLFAVLAAVLDAAFPAAVALSLWKPLWRGPNPANRVFLALLAGMTIASLLVHLQALGLTRGTAPAGDRLMLGLILMTLLVVAGRIMPFFTRSAIQGVSPRSHPWVERLTFGLAALWIAAETASHLNLALGAGMAELTGALALALALVQGARLLGWHDGRVWGIPILAVLYSGYLWLILGLALKGLARLGLLAPFPALHALTIGAVGVFTLGMMSRVTLGHTGRMVGAAPPMVGAFAALNLAAAARVLGPLAWPGVTAHWLTLSGVLWVLAFGIFLWVHAPMFLSARVDGRPG
jgi:uncharacterized protein involved in response to NO